MINEYCITLTVHIENVGHIYLSIYLGIERERYTQTRICVCVCVCACVYNIDGISIEMMVHVSVFLIERKATLKLH